jgi:uncharacterized protein
MKALRPKFLPALGRALGTALQGRRWLALQVCVSVLTGCAGSIRAAESLPPVPKHYFNDYAKVVSPAASERLNKKLEDFEHESSNQILVAVYPKMESDSSIEDYTVRVAQSWRVGQKAKNNGAVLFVFIQDRKMFIQVGYGLEGAVPDALAKQIIENELKPRFRQGDFEGGLSAGVDAILAATRGEYKGTGRIAAGRGQMGSGIVVILVLVVFGFGGLALLVALTRGRRGYQGGWLLGSGGSSWGGGTGGGLSGGSGFSSGGGSFGGGGAGGSW